MNTVVLEVGALGETLTGVARTPLLRGIARAGTPSGRSQTETRAGHRLPSPARRSNHLPREGRMASPGGPCRRGRATPYTYGVRRMSWVPIRRSV